MKKNQLTFKILSAAKNITMSGLNVTQILLDNKFSYSGDMLGGTKCKTDNSQLMIGLKGLFLHSQEQMALQQLAFQKEAIEADISNSQFQLKGLFQIQKYEIESNAESMDFLLSI